MEDIDIENLDFEAYNREMYQKEKKSVFKKENNSVVNLGAFKKFKFGVNIFVKEYEEKNKTFDENAAKDNCSNKVMKIKKIKY